MASFPHLRLLHVHDVYSPHFNTPALCDQVFFGQCSMRDFHSLRKLANGYWHYMPWHQSHWSFPFMPWRFQFSLVKKRTRESGHGPDGGLQTSCRPAVGSAAFDSASKNSRERSPLPVCRARYLRYCEALGERESIFDMGGIPPFPYLTSQKTHARR